MSLFRDVEDFSDSLSFIFKYLLYMNIGWAVLLFVEIQLLNRL